jgi:hypothetical protein
LQQPTNQRNHHA